jgi:hypothetical protein
VRPSRTLNQKTLAIFEKKEDVTAQKLKIADLEKNHQEVQKKISQESKENVYTQIQSNAQQLKKAKNNLEEERNKLEKEIDYYWNKIYLI